MAHWIRRPRTDPYSVKPIAPIRMVHEALSPASEFWGAVLFGEAGAGKTTIAARVADHVSAVTNHERRTLVWLTAGRSLEIKRFVERVLALRKGALAGADGRQGGRLSLRSISSIRWDRANRARRRARGFRPACRPCGR